MQAFLLAKNSLFLRQMPKKKSLVINKLHLSEDLYNKVGYTKQWNEEVVEEILSLMKENLKKGFHVKIHGFGKFELQDKKERMGRNPQTGEPFIIKARRVLKFHCSPVFKKMVK